jgi:hypothetical protein
MDIFDYVHMFWQIQIFIRHVACLPVPILHAMCFGTCKINFDNPTWLSYNLCHNLQTVT